MNVLVACEESQVVCSAFRSKGHNAFSCDLKPCSGGHPEWHIISDATLLLSGGAFVTSDFSYHFVDNWDLLIAHPPCTFLTKASNPCIARDNSRILKGFDAARLFLEFYNCSIPRICVENPVPLKMFHLPAYSQIIQPYYFGHPFSKMTCLWLKNLPPLFASCLCYEHVSWVYSSCDATLRSKTFSGIAAAMASQWSF